MESHLLAADERPSLHASLHNLMARFGIQGGAAAPERQWTLEALAGRFIELSSDEETASLTATTSLIREVQLRGEPAAWITVGESVFYPPDMADSGVDLGALPVVRVADSKTAARAADRLMRSGGFGLVVLDLGRHTAMRIAVQARLAGLAKKYHTALVCLTRKSNEMPSIGSLVSIRARTSVVKTGFNRFTWEVHVVKDKRLGPGWRHAEECRGPDGLC